MDECTSRILNISLGRQCHCVHAIKKRLQPSSPSIHLRVSLEVTIIPWGYGICAHQREWCINYFEHQRTSWKRKKGSEEKRPQRGGRWKDVETPRPQQEWGCTPLRGPVLWGRLLMPPPCRPLRCLSLLPVPPVSPHVCGGITLLPRWHGGCRCRR